MAKESVVYPSLSVACAPIFLIDAWNVVEKSTLNQLGLGRKLEKVRLIQLKQLEERYKKHKEKGEPIPSYFEEGLAQPPYSIESLRELLEERRCDFKVKEKCTVCLADITCDHYKCKKCTHYRECVDCHKSPAVHWPHEKDHPMIPFIDGPEGKAYPFPDEDSN